MRGKLVSVLDVRHGETSWAARSLLALGIAAGCGLSDHSVGGFDDPGRTTSGCVRGSVVDAFAYNFKVVVPQECVYDRSETSHAVNLFDMASKYADVRPVADVMASLAALPARA